MHTVGQDCSVFVRKHDVHVAECEGLHHHASLLGHLAIFRVVEFDRPVRADHQCGFGKQRQGSVRIFIHEGLPEAIFKLDKFSSSCPHVKLLFRMEGINMQGGTHDGSRNKVRGNVSNLLHAGRLAATLDAIDLSP